MQRLLLAAVPFQEQVWRPGRDGSVPGTSARLGTRTGCGRDLL